MSRSTGESLFQASGPAKENARWPSALRRLGSRYSVSWSTLVDGESLNWVGKVYRTLTHVDGVHRAAQLELNAAVTGNQWSCFRVEVTWSCCLRFIMRQAATFWTRCSRAIVAIGRPAIVKTGLCICMYRLCSEVLSNETSNLTQAMQLIKARWRHFLDSFFMVNLESSRTPKSRTVVINWIMFVPMVTVLLTSASLARQDRLLNKAIYSTHDFVYLIALINPWLSIPYRSNRPMPTKFLTDSTQMHSWDEDHSVYFLWILLFITVILMFCSFSVTF